MPSGGVHGHPRPQRYPVHHSELLSHYSARCPASSDLSAVLTRISILRPHGHHRPHPAPCPPSGDQVDSRCYHQPEPRGLPVLTGSARGTLGFPWMNRRLASQGSGQGLLCGHHQVGHQAGSPRGGACVRSLVGTYAALANVSQQGGFWMCHQRSAKYSALRRARAHGPYRSQACQEGGEVSPLQLPRDGPGDRVPHGQDTASLDTEIGTLAKQGSGRSQPVLWPVA